MTNSLCLGVGVGMGMGGLLTYFQTFVPQLEKYKIPKSHILKGGQERGDFAALWSTAETAVYG